MITITTQKDKVEQIIKDSNGGFFTVVFTKLDGSERTLNGRLGVKKYVKNTGRGNNRTEKYITIYDVKANGYRFVNKETVKEIRTRCIVFSVDDTR